jgi:hypothetical protein
MNRLRLLIVAVIVLAFAWFVPWHSSAVARVALATTLFCLPGAFLQQWIYARTPGDLIRHITVGFAVSICITSILGIIAKALHLNYTFVAVGLFLVGVVSLVGMAAQTPPIDGGRWHRGEMRYLAVLAALILASYLIVTQLGLFYSYNRGVFVDDFSYAAQTTKFRTTEPYSFQEIMHGTGRTDAVRTLLAMLPLSYAVVAELGGIATHEFFLVFRVVEVFLFIAAQLGLARALKFSRTASVLAVTVQTLIIVRFYRNDDITSLYPEFLQDKGIAAYVLAPVLMRVILDYLESPGRTAWVIGLVAVAMTFTHPTMFVITSALIGLYLLIVLAQTRRWRPVALVLVILIVGTLPHIPLRLADEQHKFSIAETDQDLKKFHGTGTWQNRMGDMTIYDYDHNLYALKLKKFAKWPYTLFFAAAILSLFRLRRSRVAIYLVAGGLLWLSVVFPLTGPIWGFLITPLHLRRALWLIPLAFAATYLIQGVLGGAAALLRWSVRRVATVNVILSLALIGVAVDQLPARVSRTPLSTGRFPPFQYHEIVSLSEQWGDLIDHPVVALGTKRYLNDVLPSLLPEVQVFYYRNVRTMMRQNNLPLNEAAKRYYAFGDLIGDKISFPAAWDLLEQYHVEYILADHENTRLVRMLGTEVPDQFVLVLRTNEYRLFRIIRKG